MKEFIVGNEYKQTISTLHLWDYLNKTKPHKRKIPKLKSPQVLYVGKFAKNDNNYIYKLINNSTKLEFEIYGEQLNLDAINNHKQVTYHGLKDSSIIIQNTKAHYGLLWYGSKLGYITNPYGEYLKINTSHKISLYIHAHLPIIVWSKASFAEFTKKHNIGICVDSIENIEEILHEVSNEKYQEMVKNIKNLSQKINQGHYFLEAYFKGEEEIMKKRVN